jgi:cysteine-rich repeat protein
VLRLGLAIVLAVSWNVASRAAAQATILPCDGIETDLNPLFLPLATLEPPLDDGSADVSLAPVFTSTRPFRFAGTSYTRMFVNVNGNVTFGLPFGSYTPRAVPGLAQPTIAPFFADVDLRPRGLELNPGRVRYCVETNRVLVTWDRVVHYSAIDGTTSFARQNRVQLVLTPATVCGTAGAVVEFRYAQLVWHAGTATGAGNDGLCTAANVTAGICTPAVAGVDYGDTRTAAQLPGSLTMAVNQTLLTQSNVGIPGVWRIEVNPNAIPSCGNSVVDGGCEDCDAGRETSTCDVDCTRVMCGDGRRNASAGEACDTGGDTASCDDDCTAPMCGDGNVNTAAGETCDMRGATMRCDADCTDVVCGDRTVNAAAGEDCDAGSETATCDGDCTDVTCGDGRRNALAGEECDDGNGTAGDGCSTSCELESCGNGRVDSGEDCDDSGESATCDEDCSAVACGDGAVNTTAGEDCDDLGESADCDADCTDARCGDGALNVTAGEACDDANLTNGDACDAACRVEECGNAVLDAGELCDAGEETATCDSDCSDPLCGDGRRNSIAGESCDDGNTAPGDGCNEVCVDEDCGNSTVDRGEDCDDGTTSPTCDPDCTDAVCGDGLLNTMAGEACDAAGESATCDDDCTAAVCGDGNSNEEAGETCDDGNTSGGDGCDATCHSELRPDGGSADGGPADYGIAGGACGCRAGGDSRGLPVLVLLALLGLALVRRGRR